MATFTRRELIIYGWSRRYTSQQQSIPHDIISMFEMYSSHHIKWNIDSSDFGRDVISDITGPNTKIEGIQFQLSGHFENFLGFSTFECKLKINPASLIRSTLRLTVQTALKANIANKQKCKNISKLDFDFTSTRSSENYKKEYSNEIFLHQYPDQMESVQDSNDIDLEFSAEVVNITYFKMNIIKSIEWTLSESEIRRFNKRNKSPCNIWHITDNWIFILTQAIPAEALFVSMNHFPLGVVELKIEYHLKIEAKGSGEDIHIEVNGKVNLTRPCAMHELSQHDSLPDVRYTQICILIEVSIVEIICDYGGDVGRKLLDKSLWSDYGYW